MSLPADHGPVQQIAISANRHCLKLDTLALVQQSKYKLQFIFNVIIISLFSK
jgi:hypothetical protein